MNTGTRASGGVEAPSPGRCSVSASPLLHCQSQKQSTQQWHGQRRLLSRSLPEYCKIKKKSIISWAHALWPSEFHPACTQRRHSAQRRANFLEVPFRGSAGPKTGAVHFMEWPSGTCFRAPGGLPGSSPSPGWASGADHVHMRSLRSPALTLPPILVLGRDKTAAHFALSFLPRGSQAPCLPVTHQKVRGCAGQPWRTACPPGLPGRRARLLPTELAASRLPSCVGWKPV